MAVVPLLLFGVAPPAWVLVAPARTRPAWPVALIGLTTVSYAFAALVTADGLPDVWRVALGSPVVVFAWGVVRPVLR